jgi:hypothetical protein
MCKLLKFDKIKLYKWGHQSKRNLAMPRKIKPEGFSHLIRKEENDHNIQLTTFQYLQIVMNWIKIMPWEQRLIETCLFQGVDASSRISALQQWKCSWQFGSVLILHHLALCSWMYFHRERWAIYRRQCKVSSMLIMISIWTGLAFGDPFWETQDSWQLSILKSSWCWIIAILHNS